MAAGCAVIIAVLAEAACSSSLGGADGVTAPVRKGPTFAYAGTGAVGYVVWKPRE